MHKLRVFDKKMLTRILGSNKVEEEEDGNSCIMRSFIIFTKYY
jgi:hypothetical protein